MPDLDERALDWCATAWHRVSRLIDAILAHPFNRALAEGTLPEETFAFYLIQDARYLEGFSRALAAAAVRAPDSADAAIWALGSQRALAAERGLHTSWLTESGRPHPSGSAVETSPSCLAYRSWLQATALSAPYPVLAAAVLPCYWVYEHVGRSLRPAAERDPDHPYRRWILTYGGEEFAAAADAARGATERAAREASPGTRLAMMESFTRATEYEWLFWDGAWRREEWLTRRWLA